MALPFPFLQHASNRPFSRRRTWSAYLLPIVPVLLSLALVGGAAVLWFVPTLERILIEQRKDQTRELVRTVWSTAAELEAHARTGDLSFAEARNRFLDHVQSLRFGDDMKDYFWVHDLDSNLLAHPYADPGDLRDYRDENGMLVVPEMNRAIANRGEGFLTYSWQKNEEQGVYASKISYLKLFEPWGWVIGAGFYEDEALAEIRALTDTFLRVTLALAAALIVLLLVAAHFNLRALRRLAEAEEAKRTSAQRLRHMAERIDHGIAIFNEGRCVYANARLHAILGLPEDTDGAVLAGRLRPLVKGSIRADEAEGEEASAAGHWEVDPAGTRRFLVVEKSCDEARDECYVVVRDETRERIRAEQVHRLSRIVEECPFSVVITNREGFIEYVNPFAARITGYKREELRGRRVSIFKSNHMPQSVYADLWKTINAGKVWRGEFLNQGKQGDYLWEAAVIAPLLDEDGTVSHFFAIKEDITDRKRLQADLHEAKERAEESDRLKSAFLANISHEIRTPLNAIAGFGEMLAHDLADHPEFTAAVATVEDNVDALVAVVDDLLEASKMEASLGPAQVDHWNLDDIIAEVVVSRLKQAGTSLSPDVEIETSLDEALEEKVVQTDRSQLFAILEELLTNAIKYTRKGRITIGYEVDAGEVVLFVCDTGSGIPEADRERLFTPFFHGSDRFVTLHRGTGLGLYLVRRRVDVMGGRIWLESPEEGGACFRLAGVCRRAPAFAASANGRSSSSFHI